MALIHHPDLDVEYVEVPDDTVEIWCSEPGWRPGTKSNPEPWNPPVLDENGNPIPEPQTPEGAADLSETPADTGTGSKKRRSDASPVPVGDPTTTPDTED